MSITTTELSKSLAFLAEADRLKGVERKSPLLDRSRRENSAEHSWHVALFALVLGTRDGGVDLDRVIRMLLVHDLVEIDAGDFGLHDRDRNGTAILKAERTAAERIYGILPEDLREDLMSLWIEFDAGVTAEARVANALDRLQPLIANLATGGGTWTEADLTLAEIEERYGAVIGSGMPEIWRHVRDAVRRHFDVARAPDLPDRKPGAEEINS